MLVKGLYNTNTGYLTTENLIEYNEKYCQNRGVYTWCPTCGVSRQTVVKTCHRGCSVRTGAVLTGAGAVCENLPAV